MTLLQNPMAFPVHVQSWKRPAGSIDYRVTNPYGGVDLVNPGQSHLGVDLGNTRPIGTQAGDPIRMPATASVRSHRHTDGALGIYIDLGGGWILEMWHLSRLLTPLDTWTPKSVGTIVGYTGASGQVAGAHTHVELKQGGKNVDPEPFLPMVEREALVIPGATAGSYYFADVPPTHPFFVDIEWMGQVLGGGPRGGNFGPDRAVTRAQLAAFLHRLFLEIAEK